MSEVSKEMFELAFSRMFERLDSDSGKNRDQFNELKQFLVKLDSKIDKLESHHSELANRQTKVEANFANLCNNFDDHREENKKMFYDCFEKIRHKDCEIREHINEKLLQVKEDIQLQNTKQEHGFFKWLILFFISSLGISGLIQFFSNMLK